MKLTTLLIGLLLGLTVCSCVTTSADIDANIEQAEREFSEGDTKKALEIGEDILEKTTLDQLTVGQLCSLAHLFVELSDQGEDPDATLATAARCLEAANAIAPDSVSAFMRELPLDEQGRIAILEYLAGKLENRLDTLLVDGDTITIIEDPHEHYYTDSL